VNVIEQRSVVQAPPGFGEDCLVTVAKEPASQSVPDIKTPGVGVLQPLHAGDEIGPRGFQQEMIMIGRQDPGMDPPAGFAARLRQGAQEKAMVALIAKDAFPPVAPRHDVVKSARILDADAARHGENMALASNGIKKWHLTPISLPAYEFSTYNGTGEAR